MSGFRPDEVLFSASNECNLSCGHCNVKRTRRTLSVAGALRFLRNCKSAGVERVGFTGGEPFLRLDFLCAVTRAVVDEGLLFDRIMTNAVWWLRDNDLKISLIKLFNAGYDGSICISVDSFHRQNIDKIARFVKYATHIWNRPDIISIAYVRGARDIETQNKLKELSLAMKRCRCRAFIRHLPIDISPVGNAIKYRDPWNSNWFKDDMCRGPGNVFYVQPDGDVKPCCGYATERPELSIGNIERDSASGMVKNLKKNAFVHTVFNAGLAGIRKRLEKNGITFPGRTDNHCFFCDYILGNVPRRILAKSLLAIAVFIMLAAQHVIAKDLTVAKDVREIPITVVKKLPVPKGYHEGLFFDGKSLLLANGENGDIWVVDPSTGTVNSSIHAVSDFVEAFIKTKSGAIFTTEWNDKKIYSITLNGAEMSVKKEASFDPAHPAGLISTGDRLFIVTWTRGLGTKFHIVVMDEELNTVNTIMIKDIQEPDQLAWDGKYLWVSSWYSKAVYRVDTAIWEVTGYFKSPVAKTTGIAWDGRYLWLTGTYSDLYQIDIGN